MEDLQLLNSDMCNWMSFINQGYKILKTGTIINFHMQICLSSFPYFFVYFIMQPLLIFYDLQNFSPLLHLFCRLLSSFFLKLCLLVLLKLQLRKVNLMQQHVFVLLMSFVFFILMSLSVAKYLVPCNKHLLYSIRYLFLIFFRL